MDKALDCRSQAAECRALARKARAEEHRQQLLEMAKMWEVLAADRESRSKLLRMISAAD